MRLLVLLLLALFYQQVRSLGCTFATGGTMVLDTTSPDGVDYLWHPRLDTAVSLRTGDGQILIGVRVPPRTVLRFPLVLTP